MQFARDKYMGDGCDDALVADVGAYADSLARAAKAYADSLRPDLKAFDSFDHEQVLRARGLHEKLRRAGTVAVFQPLMIALRQNQDAAGRGYNDVLDLALRFAVRTYLIGGYRADTAQTRLYRLANEIYQGTRSAESAQRALRGLVAEYADDHYLRSVLLNLDENWYRWSALKFFLYEYELNLLRGAAPDTDYSYFEKSKRQKTVEHILPQTATSKYWTEQFDNDQRRRCTHALGNLALTLDNSAYSNKDFPAKRGAAGPGEPERTCYAQGALRQERELAKLADWDAAQVEKRQKRLAKWALGHWAVDLTGLDDERATAPDEVDMPDEPGDDLPPLLLAE